MMQHAVRMWSIQFSIGSVRLPQKRRTTEENGNAPSNIDPAFKFCLSGFTQCGEQFPIGTSWSALNVSVFLCFCGKHNDSSAERKAAHGTEVSEGHFQTRRVDCTLPPANESPREGISRAGYRAARRARAQDQRR